MTTQQQASALAGLERLVASRVPGWTVWAIRPSTGPITWSAKPDGAPAAVISGVVLPDALVEAVRHYEKHLDDHLDDARALLASVPNSGIGLDRAAQLTLLVPALEALQRKLGDQAGY